MPKCNWHINQHGKINQVGELRTGRIGPIKNNYVCGSTLREFAEHVKRAVCADTGREIDPMPTRRLSVEQWLQRFPSQSTPIYTICHFGFGVALRPTFIRYMGCEEVISLHQSRAQFVNNHSRHGRLARSAAAIDGDEEASVVR